MTVFWSLATVMLLLALLFVVFPLLRPRATPTVDRDALNAEVARARLAELDQDLDTGRIEQAQYDAARADLERELLNDLAGDSSSAAPVRSGVWATLLIAIAVPVGATLLYKSIGSERIITLLQENPPARQAEMARQAQQTPQMSIEEMVSKLAARMESQPDDLKGWLMLAKSYSVLNRYALAVPAYRNIMRLGGGDNAGVLADFADALAATNDGRFTDEAGTLLARALALEPDNLKALWLAGHWKNQSGDTAAAIGYWQQAASLMQPQSEDWQIITDQIERARQRAGLPAAEAPPVQVAQAEAGAPAAAAGKTVLTVTVTLDPALADRTSPDDTVFIFARAVNGPRMPLAIVRKQVKDLPVTVTLDDSMAMAPAMKLSGFDPVSVGARISKSGNAMPQSGDFEGSASPVSTAAATSLEITIDSAVP
jgi:cytochrome c-type biogenesis protein CcmH